MAADRAILAPSVHNTQPWSLRLFADRLELHVDRARQLALLDPDGRELLLSVGAAVLNARVGMAGNHVAALVDRLPDPSRPALAAVLRPGSGDPDSGLAALAPLIELRHSNRSPFSPDPPTPELVADLLAAASAEETVLVPVGSEDRAVLDQAARQAATVQADDPGHLTERRRWTTRPAGAPDGLPSDVLGTSATTGDTTAIGLFVLATAEDEPLSWLRAGEALERALLEVARHGYQASLNTQLIEVAGTRVEVQHAITPGLFPQVVLRVGRADPVPGTRRRRAVDVLHDLTCVPSPNSAEAPR